MRRNFLLDAIAHPEDHPLVFIFIITLALGVAANGLSALVLDSLGALLEQHLGFPKDLWQLIVVGILIGSVLLGLSNVIAWINRLFGGAARIERAQVIPLEETKAGLIVIMSLGANVPAKAAIEHHWDEGNGNLAHCWLISTDQSLPGTQQLVQTLVQSGIPQRCFHYGEDYDLLSAWPQSTTSRLVVEPQYANDPNYIRRLVNDIYEDALFRYDLRASNLIADYTGGTKSMTAGLTLACATPDRHLQYIASDYVDGQPVNSRIMEVQISYRLKPVKSPVG